MGWPRACQEPVTPECVSALGLVPHQLWLFRVSSTVSANLCDLIPHRKKTIPLRVFCRCSTHTFPLDSWAWIHFRSTCKANSSLREHHNVALWARICLMQLDRLLHPEQPGSPRDGVTWFGAGVSSVACDEEQAWQAVMPEFSLRRRLCLRTSEL